MLISSPDLFAEFSSLCNFQVKHTENKVEQEAAQRPPC